MCEYCENNSILMSFDESVSKEGYLAIVEKNWLEVSNDYGVTRIMIHHCPICGINLKEQSNETQRHN